MGWKKTSCFISYSYVPNCRDVNNEWGVCVLSETLKKGVIIRRGIGTFYQKMSKISIKIFPAWVCLWWYLQKRRMDGKNQKIDKRGGALLGTGELEKWFNLTSNIVTWHQQSHSGIPPTALCVCVCVCGGGTRFSANFAVEGNQEKCPFSFVKQFLWVGKPGWEDKFSHLRLGGPSPNATMNLDDMKCWCLLLLTPGLPQKGGKRPKWPKIGPFWYLLKNFS